jgi:hypothetical protein
MMDTLILIVVLILIIIGVVLLGFGFRKLKNFQLISDTPRSKIRSMAMGLVELFGTITGSEFIKTPFSKIDCVFYEYRIEEYTRTTKTDSDGKTKVEYEWRTVASGKRWIRFPIQDETGEVLIDPDKADINAPLKRMYYQARSSAWKLGSIINALRDWDNTSDTELDTNSWDLKPIDPNKWQVYSPRVGDRKYYESFLEPGENLFVLGTAANESTDPNNVIIKKGLNEPTFIISYKSERELLKSLKLQIIALFIFGCLLIVIGVAIGLLFSSL